MKISIITVCKNAEKTIARTIDGILSQTYPDVEYIILDGDSTDNTKIIIANYLEQYGDRIHHYISKPDGGIYQAMNQGIQLATGDYLYFANADDYLYDANVIQDVVDFLKAHPDCDFVYGTHEARFPSGESSFHSAAPVDRILEEMVCLGECFIQPESFFKAELFNQLGGFSEDYKIASDYEWFARLLQAEGVSIYHYPRVIVSYAHGGASSQIVPLFTEVFAIQNQMPLYQTEYWLQKRLEKLQASFVQKSVALDREHALSLKRKAHIDRLEAKVQQLETDPAGATVDALKAEIAAMKTSKFWQLRSIWFQVKRSIGIRTED